jgi:hypothetical protein
MRTATVVTSPLKLPARPSTSSTFLTFEPAEFQSKFNRIPFLIKHSLGDHPLFAMERLLELARKQPRELIEYNAGELDVNQSPDETPLNGLSVEETVRRIRECKSWMVLKHVQHDPEYRELLLACLDQMRPLTERIAPGMCHPQAFIFLTSPGSVTPYHMDPEHNFLLQVRGSKTIHLFDGRDRRIVSEQDLEVFYGGNTRHMKLADENRERCWVFQLRSGSGLHFPVCYPHYVTNSDEVSVSFSITFRTPDLERRRVVYEANHQQRLAGRNPPAYGAQPWRDDLIFHGHRVQRKLGRLFGRKDS